MKNYYEELGVSSDADIAEIKKAYLLLLKKYHPDIYQGDKKYAEEQTQKINIIYNTLKDESQRKNYDNSVGLSKEQVVTQNQPASAEEKDVHSRRKADYDGGIFSGLKNRWANAFSYDDYDENKNSQQKPQKKSINSIIKNETEIKKNIPKTEPKSAWEEKEEKDRKKITFYLLLISGIIIIGLILLFIL